MVKRRLSDRWASGPEHMPAKEEQMAETHQVAINNMAFNPASLAIKAGDTVVWTNQMTIRHTVTNDKTGEPPDSGPIEPQDTFSYAFSAPGSVAYHCEFHRRAMKGTVTVT